MSCTKPSSLPGQTALFEQVSGRLNMAIKRGDAVCETLDFACPTVGYEVAVEVYSLRTGAVVQAISPSVIDEDAGTYAVHFGYGDAVPLPAGLYGVRAKWVVPGAAGAPGRPRTVLDGYLEVQP
jgi:hypothetical protein